MLVMTKMGLNLVLPVFMLVRVKRETMLVIVMRMTLVPVVVSMLAVLMITVRMLLAVREL